MRLNNFAYNPTKRLFPCLGVAVALLVGCDGGSNGALNGPQSDIYAANLDELPNCSANREGSVAYVESEDANYVCVGRHWAFQKPLMDSVATEDDLPACMPKYYGDSLYVKADAAVYVCMQGRWCELAPIVASSSSAVVGRFSEEENLFGTMSSSAMIEEPESSSFSAVESSSSNAFASSSSAMESSSSNADAVCYGEYSGEYTCITTKYLNQKMLDANGYGEFVDTRDKKVYKTVTIGAQTWMAQNLNYAYNKVTAKSYCYNDDTTFCDKYGRLYDWNAAMDACPSGWHLPGQYEYELLINHIDSTYLTGHTGNSYSEIAGKHLKAMSGWYSVSFKTWQVTDGNGSDSYGFSMLPAGSYDSGDGYLDESKFTKFWSSTEWCSYDAYYLYVYYGNSRVSLSWYYKDRAFSVRCVQNSSASGESSFSSSSAKQSGGSIVYGTLTDTRDEKSYKTLTIGDQTWMAQNLNYAPDKDYVADMGEYAWSGCYDDEATNCSKYGRLYTWEVAMDNANCAYGKTCSPSGTIRGVCPSGWHLPSYDEWQNLFTNVGGTSIAGAKLKSGSGWKENGNGGDFYGFAVYPTGGRGDEGYFGDVGYYAFFWSSSKYSSSDTYDVYFNYYDNSLVRGDHSDKRSAFSVRCVQD